MGNLYQMNQNEGGLTGFVRDLGYELEQMLTKNNHTGCEIRQEPLSKSTGYNLSWTYRGKHSAFMMITPDRSEEGKVTIDRFTAIGTAPDWVTNSEPSTSQDFRNTAQLYDDVTAHLDGKFGKPISEHHGRAIYKANISPAKMQAA